jgi:hypothetical protein
MNQKAILPITILFLMLVPLVPATTMTYTSLDTNENAPQSTTILTLTYNDEHVYLSPEDLLAFDSITGNGGRLKVTGTISGPYTYTGVLISILAQELSSMPSEYSMVAIADDGYTISYTSDEIAGNTMVYDLEGEEIGIGGVSMILATSEDGDQDYPGAYRICFVNDDEPITDSALWAKYVVELEFFAESSDSTPPDVHIVKPGNALYLFDSELIPYSQPFIIGEITIDATATDASGISKVLIVIDEDLKAEITSEPYQWTWNEKVIGTSIIEVIAYDNAGNIGRELTDVIIINPF